MSTATKSIEGTKLLVLALSEITVSMELQPRVELTDHRIAALAESYLEPRPDLPVPPVHVFWDGKRYWLVDGFHRFKARWGMRRLKVENEHPFESIECVVHEGSKQKAKVYAAFANASNRGTPLSPADIKKAVFMVMEDSEWRTKSSPAIAVRLGFSKFSSNVRKAWADWYTESGLDVPDYAESINGVMKPTRVSSATSDIPPKVWTDGRDRFTAKVSGKKIRWAAGTSRENVEAELARLHAQRAAPTVSYSPYRIVKSLSRRGFASVAIHPKGTPMTRMGFSGYITQGHCWVSSEFLDRDEPPKVLGRILQARARSGSSRAIVLCSESSLPCGLREECETDQLGIEFMTIEQFIELLESERAANPDHQPPDLTEETPSA